MATTILGLVADSLSHLDLAWAKSEAPEAAEHAVSILNSMEQQGVQPNVQMYNSAIDAIAQSGQNPEQAEVMLDHMMEAGIPPGVVTYSAIINGT